MARPPKIEFLERDSYRQRRMRDAARMLPFFASVLMVLPLMWRRDAPDDSLTSTGMIYLFALWLLAIIASFILSRLLKLQDGRTEKGGGDGT